MLNMSEVFVKPVVFISRCLGFQACRWNGVVIADSFITKLRSYVETISVCPELEIGLGVPRDPIRIVQKESQRLLQFNTSRDVSEQMTDFSKKFLAGLGDVDGFILKDRSPSCGIKDVKVYPGLDKSNVVAKTSGFFAAQVLRLFPGYPVESETRLTNFALREHFLTSLFCFARFRAMRKTNTMSALIKFHSQHKLIFMAYSQQRLKSLGRLVANLEGKSFSAILAEYEALLRKIFDIPARFTSHINVLMHALGYFSEVLTGQEKRFFLNTLEEYRREQVPLSVPLAIARAHIIRTKSEYLSAQTYFTPYPKELVLVSDSGKGRND